MKRTPLRPKSIRPKVKHPERTAHLGRMKRTATERNALEEAHEARVRKLPCCVTGKRPVVLHHLMRAPDKRCRRDPRWCVPLIEELHNMGDDSVHMLGSEELFEEQHMLGQGFLIAWAKREWERSNEG